jgi:2-polyprenyl-6-hydroxyphenyl methylase/3-demethylubiquinone-9 3-methyltransferase
MTFLDAGCGSGLFSLAAHQLGAKVHSFDFDPNSVACAQVLKQKFAATAPEWSIEEGSVLDRSYLGRLGKFDIVYSWGVLHHTGQMREAIANVSDAVAAGGQFCLAIYNDQRWISRYWTTVKKIYNSGVIGRAAMTAYHAPYLFGLRYLVRAVTRRGKLERGMSLWHDTIDWLGGYPFEVAKPEEIVAFLRARGFVLENMITCGGRMGCNEFTFRKV